MSGSADNKAPGGEMSNNRTFETIQATVSSWYDDNKCLPMLRVLFRDHVDPPELKKITLTVKILDKLIMGGHLSSKDISIICDTIRITKHFGLQMKLQEIMLPFPDVKTRTITHFTGHRQNLMKVGMVLNAGNVIRIDGMYNQPLKEYANAWEMITDLEDRDEIQEGRMEKFKETLRILDLRQALGKLTEGTTSNTNPVCVPVPVATTAPTVPVAAPGVLSYTSNTNPVYVPVPVYVPLPVEPTASPGSFEEEYKMTSSPRGMCIIINNMNFDKKDREDLEGYKYDEVHLRDVFKDQFDFIVNISCNQTAEQIKGIIEQCSEMDHAAYDCFIFCVLSHGGLSKDGKEFIEGTQGGKVMISEITSPFGSRNCLSLKDKPKVFFIQACRGDIVEYATVASGSIPNESHFLTVYGTVRGKVSIVTEHGSTFIQTLTTTLKKQPERNILEILPIVIRKVANSPTKVSVKDEAGNPKIVPAVHTPVFESSLQKTLIFRRKLNPVK